MAGIDVGEMSEEFGREGVQHGDREDHRGDDFRGTNPAAGSSGWRDFGTGKSQGRQGQQGQREET
ncbi:hypothetical protein SDC9_203585 [bioreactor metagenome]|uniref:Uncharacterized protein n=1 Tax=bioreactor metagenome TaxID=1076179 RepID=A0A645IX34_9ZZZZ